MLHSFRGAPNLPAFLGLPLKKCDIRLFSSTERGLFPVLGTGPPLSAENRELAQYRPALKTSGPVHNQRTILVVDDDAKILKLVAGFLGDNGYTILTAKSGAAALALAKSHAGVIHLLLSDFEMPEMAGIELATALTLVRPEIKVLMMSGFRRGMLVLNEGWHFLAKPFVASQLRSLVTSLLFPDKSRFRALGENASQLPDLKD